MVLARHGLIANLVPTEVASCEKHDDDGPDRVFPEEAALIARAADARRREFAGGRSCARAALHRLGLPPSPILQGAHREPLWPEGVVGSITHCDRYRAACVAWGRDASAIGIDAEPHAALPGGVLEQVATAPERAWLGEAPRGYHWDRILFSAKESLFKAWHPLTHRWLGFEDAVVTVRPEDRTFSVRVLVPPPRFAGRDPAAWCGRFLVRDGLVLTTVIVPGSGAAPTQDPKGRPSAPGDPGPGLRRPR